MSGRRLVPLTVLTAGLILCMGCQGRPNSGTPSTPPSAAKISGNAPTSGTIPALAATRPTEKTAAVPPTEPPRPALRISPETFTITADDPGLQLLAAR
jgi:hypothetical protein